MSDADADPETDTEPDDDERLVPDTRAARELVTQLSLPGADHHDARHHRRENMRHLYEALIRAEPEELRRPDLRRHFRSAGTEDLKQGLHAAFSTFEEQYIEPYLAELPGVEREGEGRGAEWRYVGATAEEFLAGGLDEAEIAVHCRPLEAHRSDPEIDMHRWLDEHTDDPYGEHAENLEAVWRRLAEAGHPLETEHLVEGFRSPVKSADDPLLDDLADMPHVTTETTGSPDADDLVFGPGEDIETLADLQAAQSETDAEPVTTYQYEPESAL